MELLFSHPRAEVWCANSLDQQEVRSIMDGRVADALITDAPYSAKTHNGHKAGKITADRAAGFAGSSSAESRYAAKVSSGLKERADIEYAAWSANDVKAFCDAWWPHVQGWWVSITDHVLARAWEDEFGRALYVFPPLPFVETGSRVRMQGDGPSGWTCWCIVARPKTAPWSSWGTLDGAYVQPVERAINSALGSDRITGGKPTASMVKVVADYTREVSPLYLAPGTQTSLVVDPCAGGGTTLLAALRTGRRCIGIERDPGRAELCAERVRSELIYSDRRLAAKGQEALFGGLFENRSGA